MLPGFLDIGSLEVVDRKLLLIGQADVSILHFPAGLRIARPNNLVDRIDVLQKSAKPLQTVSKFGGYRIEIDAAALLKISELRDLQTVQHHLPSDTPGAECGRLPVVFFELDVVLAQVNADRSERLEVQLLHVLWRGLQDYLQLQVLEEAVRILAVTSVGRTSRGLHVSDLVRIRPEHAQKCFRRHGARSDLNVIRLLNDRSALRKESLEREDKLLESRRVGLG